MAASRIAYLARARRTTLQGRGWAGVGGTLACTAVVLTALVLVASCVDVPPEDFAPARYDGCWDNAFGEDTSVRARFQISDDDEHYVTIFLTRTTAGCDASLDRTAEGVTYQQLYEALLEFEDDGDAEDSKNVALHVIASTITPLSAGAVTLWETACGGLEWDEGVTTSAYRSDCLQQCLPSRDGSIDGDTWYDVLVWESSTSFYMGAWDEGVFPFPCSPSERPDEANTGLLFELSETLPDPDGDPDPPPSGPLTGVPPEDWEPGVYHYCLGSEGAILAGWESTEYYWRFEDDDCELSLHSRPAECGTAVALSDDLFPDQNLFIVRYDMQYELLDDSGAPPFTVPVHFEVRSVTVLPTNEAGANYWRTRCIGLTFDVGSETDVWGHPCIIDCPPRRDGEVPLDLYDVMVWSDDYSFSNSATGFVCDEPSIDTEPHPVVLFRNVDADDASAVPSAVPVTAPAVDDSSASSCLQLHAMTIAILLLVVAF